MLDLSRFHFWEHSLLAVQCYDWRILWICSQCTLENQGCPFTLQLNRSIFESLDAVCHVLRCFSRTNTNIPKKIANYLKPHSYMNRKHMKIPAKPLKLLFFESILMAYQGFKFPMKEKSFPFPWGVICAPSPWILTLNCLFDPKRGTGRSYSRMSMVFCLLIWVENPKATWYQVEVIPKFTSEEIELIDWKTCVS